MLSSFRSRRSLLGAVIGCSFVGMADYANAQEQPANTQAQAAPQEGTGDVMAPINWERGPTTSKIGDLATIKVPSGFKYTGADGAKAFLTSIGSPPNPKTVGLLVPLGLNPQWVVAFTFEDMGRVADADQMTLDAEKLIEAMKLGLDRLNQLRKAASAPPMTDLEWIQKPTYDAAKNRLTWAVRGVVPGEKGTANYDVRFLGKDGVMKVTVITTGDKYDSVVSQVKPLLEDFQFAQNSRYSDWREGDKAAPISLSELVAGGSAGNRGIVGFLKSDTGLLLLALGGGTAVFALVMIAAGISIARKAKSKKPA